MKVRYLLLLLLAWALLTSTGNVAWAEVIDVTVDPNGQWTTIAQGITQAQTLATANPTKTYRVFVQPGTYTGPFTAVGGIDIVGSSTANTFIDGSASIATFSGIKSGSVTIRNFTFQNGASISVNSSSSITVKNIVFNVGSTAITVADSSSTQIVNNTFYKFTTAAIRTDSELSAITNNIFANNAAAISGTSSALSQPTYNDYFGNGRTGVNLDRHSLPNTDHRDPDPLFVNPGTDFHLRTGSPAIGTGNPSFPNASNRNGSVSDMGAYGGPDADLPPAQVSGVTASLSNSTITVSWSPSSDPNVTGYRVYYGTISGGTAGFTKYNGTGATEGNSPIPVLGRLNTTTTLSKIPPVTALRAPVVTNHEPLDGAIKLAWSAVAGATRYQVYYSTDQHDPKQHAIAVPGTQTSTTISGITNLQHYFISVQAFADNQIFIAVTAVVSTDSAPAAGSSNESSYSTETSPLQIDTPVGSESSAAVEEFPEAPSPFPDLKGGCFIATAAYGFYSSPQVQALRDFRDRYLMTNDYGRAFVTWYYRYGPIGARYLNDHPWLKAPVRALLLPLVALSIFLVYTPPLIRVAVLMMVLVVGVYIFDSLKRRLWVGEVW